MTAKRTNTTIRLDPVERQKFEKKMEQYGYTEMSPFIRFAVQQLPEKE